MVCYDNHLFFGQKTDGFLSMPESFISLLSLLIDINFKSSIIATLLLEGKNI